MLSLSLYRYVAFMWLVNIDMILAVLSGGIANISIQNDYRDI